MPVPDYLTDQNEDFIKSRGFTFRDFSTDQIIEELRIRDIRISIRGIKEEKRNALMFRGIADSVPHCGIRNRWAVLKNPFTRNIYRCTRVERFRIPNGRLKFTYVDISTRRIGGKKWDLKK